MIDPDNMLIINENLPSIINVNEVPKFEFEIYNLDDEKDYNKFITDTERCIRKSFEYKTFLGYIRDNFNMNECAFLKDVNNKETYAIKIEIHHYPFSLHDIVDIVVKKRMYYNEYISVYMVAKEVMMLHYRMMVGLIPLSETVHELYHNGRLFIPTDKVFGRYKLFVDYYGPFIDKKELDSLERAEKYTLERSEDRISTTILDTNQIRYNVADNLYRLPNLGDIRDAMSNQISYIKSNGYLLPGPKEVEEIKGRKEAIKPIKFFE